MKYIFYTLFLILAMGAENAIAGSEHHNNYYTYPEIPYVPVEPVVNHYSETTIQQINEATVLGIATDHHYNFQTNNPQLSPQVGYFRDTWALSVGLGKRGCLPGAKCSTPMMYNAAVGIVEGGDVSVKAGFTWEIK